MADKRFEELKMKYQTALRVMEQQQVRLHNLHVENDKLFIRGTAPSEAAKNAVWDQIKLADPTYSDLTCDITVEEQAAAPAAAQPAPPAEEHYTVQPGDTLSKIAKQYYGNASAYMRIFEANRNILTDPNKIQVGQRLLIPKD